MGEHAAAGLLLAAGGGRRYGKPKALVEHTPGQLLVERGLASLREGGCAPVVVVLGAAAEQVRSRADLTGAHVVVNDDWGSGLGSSLRSGLTALTRTAAEATVVVLVDTPGVTGAAVARLRAYAAPTALAAANYAGRQGHPVLLGRDHWGALLEHAQGDVGARPYLAAHADRLIRVSCEDVADDADLDRPGDPDPLFTHGTGA